MTCTKCGQNIVGLFYQSSSSEPYHLHCHVTDAELARELAGYVINRVSTHLGIECAEIDLDCDTKYMSDLIANLRSDYGVLSEEQHKKYEEEARNR